MPALTHRWLVRHRGARSLCRPPLGCAGAGRTSQTLAAAHRDRGLPRHRRAARRRHALPRSSAVRGEGLRFPPGRLPTAHGTGPRGLGPGQAPAWFRRPASLDSLRPDRLAVPHRRHAATPSTSTTPSSGGTTRTTSSTGSCSTPASACCCFVARVQPRWALGLLVAGIGALLAIAWELAEWYAFIRHGTELDDRVRGHARRPGAGLTGRRPRRRPHRAPLRRPFCLTGQTRRHASSARGCSGCPLRCGRSRPRGAGQPAGRALRRV